MRFIYTSPRSPAAARRMDAVAEPLASPSCRRTGHLAWHAGLQFPLGGQHWSPVGRDCSHASASTSGGSNVACNAFPNSAAPDSSAWFDPQSDTSPASPVHSHDPSPGPFVACTPGASGPESPPESAAVAQARQAKLVFEQLDEAVHSGRWSEAYTVLEEVLGFDSYAPTAATIGVGLARPPGAAAQLPLPAAWPLERCQLVLLECCLHGGAYAKCTRYARSLRLSLPMRTWGRLLWLEGLALARSGRASEAIDALIAAFMEGTVAEEQRGLMRASFAAAGAFDADECTLASGSRGQAAAHAVAPAAADNWTAGAAASPPVGAIHHEAADVAFPWVTTDTCAVDSLFVPLDEELEGSCGLQPGWYDGKGPTGEAAECDTEAGEANGYIIFPSYDAEELEELAEMHRVWGPDGRARFLLFGKPCGWLLTQHPLDAPPERQAA